MGETGRFGANLGSFGLFWAVFAQIGRVKRYFLPLKYSFLQSPLSLNGFCPILVTCDVGVMRICHVKLLCHVTYVMWEICIFGSFCPYDGV